MSAKTTNNNVNNNGKTNEKSGEIKKKLYQDAPKYLVPPDDEELIKKIGECRKLLEEDFKVNSAQYWDKDMEKVMKCDFEVRRFLFQTNLDVESATEMIKERLAWRKGMGIEGARPERFPIEFYESGSIFEFKTDRDGDPVLYVRSKFNIKSEVLATPIRQFLLYNMDLMDQRFSSERCWGLVFDAQGFGWSNIDFDFLHLIIKVFRHYMPWTVKYIIVYEIPWVLESVWRGVQHFIPEDGKRILRVYNKKTITEVIEPENLPALLGGLNKEEYIRIPEGCKPADEVGKIELGLSSEDVNKIRKHLEKIISGDKEIRRLVASG